MHLGPMTSTAPARYCSGAIRIHWWWGYLSRISEMYLPDVSSTPLDVGLNVVYLVVATWMSRNNIAILPTIKSN